MEHLDKGVKRVKDLEEKLPIFRPLFEKTLEELTGADTCAYTQDFYLNWLEKMTDEKVERAVNFLAQLEENGESEYWKKANNLDDLFFMLFDAVITNEAFVGYAKEIAGVVDYHAYLINCLYLYAKLYYSENERICEVTEDVMKLYRETREKLNELEEILTKTLLP